MFSWVISAFVSGAAPLDFDFFRFIKFVSTLLILNRAKPSPGCRLKPDPCSPGGGEDPGGSGKLVSATPE